MILNLTNRGFLLHVPLDDRTTTTGVIMCEQVKFLCQGGLCTSGLTAVVGLRPVPQYTGGSGTSLQNQGRIRLKRHQAE